ncbi:MAG: VWA domain-containing protein [Rhodothermales bacterium]
MEWLNPTFLWALVGAPLAAGLLLWAAWRRREALRRFGELEVVSKLAAAVSSRRRRWKAAAVVGGVLLLALALAGPRFGTKLREVKREGIDLVIALDVSASMMAEDVAPNRLSRAKNEIKKLLGELRGDRVALIIFAGDAFIQCPLTTDYSALRLFLDVADPTMIPTPGTDFNAALRMAMQAFESTDEVTQTLGTRALLFVSDGENHVADLADLVETARGEGIVIYAAGVGETSGAPIPLYHSGRRIGYKKDSEGNIVHSRLGEDVLRGLASEGAYFRIARTSSSLSEITSSLERLQKQEFAREEYEEYEERYQWPLAAALILLLLERFVSDRRRTSSVPASV